jgi:murein DD-endopeptidase MepM/ murein hydrolase activator NlpD
MINCLYAIGIVFRRFVSPKIAVIAVGALLMAHSYPAYAVLTPEDLIPTPEEDLVDEDTCQQAWPVSCEAGGGAGGDTGCGGWQVLTDLAQSETLPGDNYPSCSTGMRLALANDQSEGEAVGAMFPGTVIFAQSGRSRDGRDYGGVVVMKLELDDGSPQCYARYMFLDRRDMVVTGEELKAGQRIGSIASNDMNATKDWWEREWNDMRPQVKIDIGCDEALANLPHFMPREPYSGDGPNDQDSCPLTKTRFPTRPYDYLTSFESVENTNCSVGIRKDARGGLTPAVPQDNSERDSKVGGQYTRNVNPRGFLKRKTTDVFSTFADPVSRENLWGANRLHVKGGNVFRIYGSYMKNTTLGKSPAPDSRGCNNIMTIIEGKDGKSIEPAMVRELMTHCANQFILGRAMYFPVVESSANTVDPIASALPNRLQEYLSEEEQEIYQEWLEKREQEIDEELDEEEKEKLEEELEEQEKEARGLVNKVYWRDLCQPLSMERPGEEFADYEVKSLLARAWNKMLVEWPREQNLIQMSRPPIQDVDINGYADYPYERIIDPSNPFSPRHIFAETERERYKNYGVQCAATPVDIILGSYKDAAGEDSEQVTYSPRDNEFHQCIKCRIEINDKKQACFPSPYSFSNPGGCDSGFGPMTVDGELCSNLPADLKALLDALEVQYGLAPNFLHAVATSESSCSATANSGAAQGMFQFTPATAHDYGINAWDTEAAAEASAKFYSRSAADYDCDIKYMVGAYHDGPGEAARLWPTRGEFDDDPEGPVNIYIARMQKMMGGNNGCSATGPFPNGDGPDGQSSGSGYSGGGGSSNGGGMAGGGGDVFGAGGSPSAATSGNFNPEGCPIGYVGNENAFAVEGGKFCPPFAYPTPELASTGWYGCRGRDFYPPGCDASCIAHFNGGCSILRQYNGPTPKDLICDPSGVCPGRIHEGMDIAPEFGAPIYASANGIVSNISSNGYVTIDHSGKCIDPDCTKRFGAGVKTHYYHMGMERVMVQENQEVKRCDQIGTVGDKLSEGAPHLHFETRDPQNTMTHGDEYSYFALAQDQRYHSHVDDKSCEGGIWDPTGEMGAQGICSFKLPVETRNKEDLAPPAYFEEYEQSPVDMPEPESPGHHTEFDLEEEGWVYNGAWTACDDPRLSTIDRERCIEFNKQEEKKPSYGGAAMINPTPCFDMTSPFGMRWHPTKGGYRMHYGVDLSAGGAEGTPVFAAADGLVVQSQVYDACGGNMTILEHANGTRTRYLHQKEFCDDVKPGTQVVQGQVIGYVGNTGECSTGAHMHFEVWNPEAMDPLEVIPAPSPGAPQCAQLRTLQCGDIAEDLPTGPGVAGNLGTNICVDKPCSVRYDEADTVAQCGWPEEDGGCGTLGNYSQRDDGEAGDCCFNITAPVTPLNILKIRPGYDNEAYNPGAVDVEDFIPGAWQGQRVNDGPESALAGTVALPTAQPDEDAEEAEEEEQSDYIVGPQQSFGEGGEQPVSDQNPGAPEGYTFYEHFRDHRPYIRWWDTGAESGNILQGHTDADSKGGSFDALVGVGVEKNNCGIGGWGDPLLYDGNTSWMELKLYQARAQFYGAQCVARYEKAFQYGSAENFVLQMAGGNFSSTLPSGGAAPVAVTWPLGWRGYASEPIPAYRFPYLVSMDDVPEYTTASGSMLGGGLDNAMPGDILVWDEDVVGQKRLPHVAYVVSADTEAMREARNSGDGKVLSRKRWHAGVAKSEAIDMVMVQDYNFGKYPDSCGNTNWMAVSTPRKIAKKWPGTEQEIERYELKQTDCGNPDLAYCVENYWDRVKIYRPRTDVRD